MFWGSVKDWEPADVVNDWAQEKRFSSHTKNSCLTHQNSTAPFTDLSINTIQVYTLGSKCWKTIQSTEGCMFSGPLNKSIHGVLINGALHWSGATTTTQGSFSEAIVCFDINSERPGGVPLPKEIIKPLQHSDAYREVGMLGVCLCIMFSLEGIRTDVWVMQDYGVRESWAKVFTTAQLRMTRNQSFKPI